MKAAIIAFFLTMATSFGLDLQLEWDPPKDKNIASYMVYMRKEPGAPLLVGQCMLGPGDYGDKPVWIQLRLREEVSDAPTKRFFVVAVNRAGYMSAPSDDLVVEKPAKPTNLRLRQ